MTVTKSDTVELGHHGGDQAKIDQLIVAFYEVISFEEGGSPDWERMRSLFSRHARITRITPEGTDYYDVDGFQEMAKEALELGLYTRFYEVETRRDERRFGGLCHVLSAGSTTRSRFATFSKRETLVPKLTRERKNKTVHRIFTEAHANGLIMNRSESASGPSLVMKGASLLNFGSCSYMALENHPALVRGAADAVEQYGTQFPFSRVYLEAPLYQTLEERLELLTGRATMVASSTTLAHLSALPALINDSDIVLIDQFAHASLHMAVELLKDTVIERLRHNRVDLLEDRIKAHASSGKTIWYVCDGLYSMLGDFADYAAIETLLERYPQLHVYVDDAHSTSWSGKHGRGTALDALGGSDRVVVALSLNKAFSGAGAALAFPTRDYIKRVRYCGGTMVFSGPIQPPMLGANIASANLHLGEGFSALQAELAERIQVARDAVAQHGLRIAADGFGPIFMVQFESAEAGRHAARSMMERGYYCCYSAFPAVPMDKPSIRFTISRHNRPSEIRAFVAEMARVVAAGQASLLERQADAG